MLFIGSRVRVEPKEHPVKKGVPQGNLLGSLLWKIYSEEPRQRAPKAVTSELVNRRDLTLGKSQELINWRKYDRDETILFQPVTLKIMTLQISSVRAVKKPYALKDLTTKEASQKACSALTHPSLLYCHCPHSSADPTLTPNWNKDISYRKRRHEPIRRGWSACGIELRVSFRWRLASHLRQGMDVSCLVHPGSVGFTARVCRSSRAPM